MPKTKTQTNLESLPGEERFLSVEDAAKFLGLSHWTIRAALSKGRLRRFKAGPGSKARVLIRLSDLRDFVREAPVKEA